MGVPIFMTGSPISYENGAPRVPKIILIWGPGSPTSYEIGDPGSPISHDTGRNPKYAPRYAAGYRIGNSTPRYIIHRVIGVCNWGTAAWSSA